MLLSQSINLIQEWKSNNLILFDCTGAQDGDGQTERDNAPAGGRPTSAARGSYAIHPPAERE